MSSLFVLWCFKPPVESVVRFTTGPDRSPLVHTGPHWSLLRLAYVPTSSLSRGLYFRLKHNIAFPFSFLRCLLRNCESISETTTITNMTGIQLKETPLRQSRDCCILSFVWVLGVGVWRRGFTQKEEHNIQKKAKDWNQEPREYFSQITLTL
jgi:hypothetical protein